MRIQPPVHLTSVHATAGAIVFDRSLWFEGEGSPPNPDTIGAKDGDCYLDTLTGDVYRLEA